MTQQPTPPAKPELRFTQNFLRDPALVDRIVTLAKIPPGSTVLEIGPGKGIITKALAERVGATGQVMAIELDSRLAQNLKKQFNKVPQVQIMTADILQFKLESLPAGYVVFSNVPFNITSELLEFLFHPKHGPVQAHLILQKDALLGTQEYGIQTETFKALLIKPLYRIQAVHSFARSDFVPQPGVETALFAFDRRSEPLIDPAQMDLYQDFLAFVSKDRVGEGVWRRLFSKPQIDKMSGRSGSGSGLINGRGLKSQSVEAIVGAFQTLVRINPAKLAVVRGAMAALREEQQRREQINREGGHRRDNQARRYKDNDK